MQNIENNVHHKVNELQLLIEGLKKPLVIRFFLWTDGKFLKGGTKKNSVLNHSKGRFFGRKEKHQKRDVTIRDN